MDFDQLHTFLEIVRLKSFSKAAQTCYRTQPAISAQVRQLEQELQTALFERFGSRISLTTAGKIFAEYAEQMLDLRRRAQDAIAELDRNPRGELVIAANEATCIYVLPQVFSEYRSLVPGRTIAGGSLLWLARGGSGDGEYRRFRDDPAAGTGKTAAGGQHPPRRDPADRAGAPSPGREEGGVRAGSAGLSAAAAQDPA